MQNSKSLMEVTSSWTRGCLTPHSLNIVTFFQRGECGKRGKKSHFTEEKPDKWPQLRDQGQHQQWQLRVTRCILGMWWEENGTLPPWSSSPTHITPVSWGKHQTYSNCGTFHVIPDRYFSNLSSQTRNVWEAITAKKNPRTHDISVWRGILAGTPEQKIDVWAKRRNSK